MIKYLIYLVISPNNEQLDQTKECYYAADLPCKLLPNDRSSQSLLNKITVTGDYIAMIYKTINMIDSNIIQSIEDNYSIQIITKKSSLPILIASHFHGIKIIISLTEPIDRLMFSYSNIILRYNEFVFSSKKEDTDSLNSLVETCIVNDCTCFNNMFETTNCSKCKDQFSFKIFIN